MSVKNECIGAIELINKRGGDGLFADADLHLLQAMSASAALAILNARMAEKLAEQERVARELELQIFHRLVYPEQSIARAGVIRNLHGSAYAQGEHHRYYKSYHNSNS